MTPIDIRPADLETVRLILREHVPAVEVRAFGSRVAWNARETSDLDLALMTDEPLTVAQMADLRAAFTGADLPFRVDIVDWASTSEAFRRVVESEHAVLVDGSDDHQGGARPVRSVEDVCLRVTSGGTPSRRQPSFYEDGCWPWLKTQELRDGWLDSSEEYITDDAVASSSAKVLPENTVLMAMYGATVGQLGILRRPMTCNQACCAMIVDPGRADYRYLFYQLLHARPRIRNLSTGAAQQNLSGQLIKSLKFPFPPLPDQRAVAHVLGTLDDKIELNRRMNATLEAMARALFRSWFVDFDPVRAKMEGRDPGLPKDIADLFPDRMVDSELGEIPEGWSLLPLTELIDVNPKRVLRKGMVAPYLDMANMPTRGHVPDSIGDRSCGSGMRFANGDTLVARITPCLENGKIAFVDFLGDGEVGWGSTEYIVLKPKPPIPDEFAYCLARSARFREFAVQNMSGTSGRQRVPATALSGYRMSVPPRGIATAFGRAARPLLARASARASESRALGAIRDALLPKLVSGELRVNVREPTRRADERPIATAGARA